MSQAGAERAGTLISITVFLHKEAFLQLNKFQLKTILASFAFLSPGLDIRVPWKGETGWPHGPSHKETQK